MLWRIFYLINKLKIDMKYFYMYIPSKTSLKSWIFGFYKMSTRGSQIPNFFFFPITFQPKEYLIFFNSDLSMWFYKKQEQGETLF